MHRLAVVTAATAFIAGSQANANDIQYMLDVPSGSGNDINWFSETGATNLPFSIDSQFMKFRQNGFATPGVVQAWDAETGTNQKGRLFLTATEGSAITGISFDLSGLNEVLSSARLKVKIDGELFKDKTWTFEGNSTLLQREWSFGQEVSEVELILQNLQDSPWAGLDNIGVSAVPAPGALALLGLAGLSGNRRRRG